MPYPFPGTYVTSLLLGREAVNARAQKQQAETVSGGEECSPILAEMPRVAWV